MRTTIDILQRHASGAESIASCVRRWSALEYGGLIARQWYVLLLWRSRNMVGAKYHAPTHSASRQLQHLETLACITYLMFEMTGGMTWHHCAITGVDVLSPDQLHSGRFRVSRCIDFTPHFPHIHSQGCGYLWYECKAGRVSTHERK